LIKVLSMDARVKPAHDESRTTAVGIRAKSRFNLKRLCV
jgi:hypothetical protein